LSIDTRSVSTSPPSYPLSLLLHRHFSFFFIDPAPTEIYTLSLHDALPISRGRTRRSPRQAGGAAVQLRLRLELDLAVDPGGTHARLRDPVRRAQPRLDDRRHPPQPLRNPHLAPQ